MALLCPKFKNKCKRMKETDEAPGHSTSTKCSKSESSVQFVNVSIEGTGGASRMRRFV